MRAIVLAAGKGTRLLREGDDFPKAMKPLCGKPILSYVLKSLGFLHKKNITVVIGYKREKVLEAFSGYNFVIQEEQLGTGHAVKVCEKSFEGYDGPVLIMLGDMPMFKQQTLLDMFALQKKNGGCVILTAISEQKLPYGRIVRDENGKFAGVAEEKDCTPEQKLIKELNPSIYVFDAKQLFSALGELRSDNAQKEYYLTDVPAILQKRGFPVTTHTIRDDVQIIGINTEEDLELCSKYLK
ncbi:MAG TPA: NTP transferase domain-containing protein [Oscillospiraceae bacterium]|nr:NTP transferase domain-containing protein [Oscillospiraceae bacterium]HPS34959.1 NTP transferase domain-containing protein [Oscillospiraceae bacterium]